MEGTTPTASKRRSCLGVTYYNAWLRTHGAPVCVGFSKQQEGNPEQSRAVVDSHVGPAPGAANFKYWCVGYSMHADGGSNSTPYCEGLEVLMNQAMKQHVTSGAAGSSSSSTPSIAASSVGMSQTAAMQSHTVHSSIQRAAQQPDQAHHQQPDHHHPAAAEGAAEEEVPSGPSLAKLYSTARRNMELVQAGLRNEGPIALRPMPASWQELGDRFWNTAARNGNNINVGMQRIARNMYTSTVKPVAAILGLNRKS